MATRTTDELGSYELLMPVASGGMARVWAARRNGAAGFRKLVAIKTILEDYAADPTFRAMFLDEARIASAIHHANVCETSDLGEDRGRLYMALEWIDGASVHRLLRGGRAVPLRLAARVVADACAGLHAAHEAVAEDGSALAVVHRDVSPHNILVSSDGVVKVTDFGVAKAFGKSHVTTAGEVKGKLSYMAPEQLREGRVDRRADVFALGCLLYEMTTGKKTFEAETDHRVVQKVLTADFVPPSEADSTYPPDLERIVLRALAASPDARFASANGLRLALERWLATTGEPITSIDLANVVRERCGHELDQRRAELHATVSARAASAATVRATSASQLVATPGERARREPRTRDAATRREGVPSARAPKRRRWLGAVIAVIATTAAAAVVATSAALHAGGLAFPEASHLARPARAATVAHPTRLASGAPSAKAPRADDADSVTIRRAPEGASLVVDGEPLAPGVVRVARPAPGDVHVVLVKADGYVERLVLVDDTTPANFDVPLDETPRPSDS